MELLDTFRKEVAVFRSQIYQTNSTVITTPRSVLVIDPCWLPDEIEAIKEYVESVRGSRSVQLMFTHSDYDHIIGRGAFPHAKVTASKAFHLKKDKQSDVDAAIHWDSRHYIQRNYSIKYPTVDYIVDKDGKSINFSGNVLTFYFAPGHTPEGLMITYEPAGVLIAGDYLSDVEFPFVEDSIEQYRRTLSKVDRILRAHQINFMIPGHGSIADSVDQIKQRKLESEEYLQDLTDNSLSLPDLEKKYAARYQYWDGLKDTHERQVRRFRTRQ